MEKPKQQNGFVIRALSGFFTVQTESGEEVVCKIPKWLRRAVKHEQMTRDQRISDIVAVGDRVTFIEDGGETGQIIEVAPRKRVLSRSRPAAGHRNKRFDREQVLVANPDQVILVFSIREPRPTLRKLDRFLVVTERNNLPTIICVNKIDLATREEAESLFSIYAKIGYRVIYTSIITGEGIESLRATLKDKLSVLTGSSGVGKSSLLNKIQSGLGLKVAAVSSATTKGRHTTRHTELISLDMGGYLADTPGIRGLALFDFEPSELDAYFREIAPFVSNCRFSDCTHTHEKQCAVLDAVKEGLVSAERFDSYLRLREEHEVLRRSTY